jgi:hypothetical protein
MSDQRHVWEVRNDGSLYQHLLYLEEQNFLHLMVRDANGELKARRVHRTSEESRYFTTVEKALEYNVEMSADTRRRYQGAVEAWVQLSAKAEKDLAEYREVVQRQMDKAE